MRTKKGENVAIKCIPSLKTDVVTESHAEVVMHSCFQVLSASLWKRAFMSCNELQTGIVF